LRRVATSNPSYPAVLFFYQGSAAEGEAFFSKYWPGARAVADSSGRLYRAFGLGRGGIREMFGPRVWVAGLRAVLKGNLGGAPTGDPWTMPGLFLVKGDAVIWEHRFRHAGDQPEFARIAASIPPS
jgi:hypothetical protein